MILFVLALSWLAGISLAALGLHQLWALVLLGGAGCSLGYWLSGSRSFALLTAAALLTCLVAISRYDSAQPPASPGGVALYNDGPEVQLRGVIVAEPEVREKTQVFRLAVTAQMDGAGVWQPQLGNVLVTARLFPAYYYGDAVEMTAKLQTPPVFDSFDFREFLARQGVVSTAVFPKNLRVVGKGRGSRITDAVIDVRNAFGDVLKRSLPEPESALSRGILLGQRAAIPEAVMQDFNDAGISHLIAISGYNVMLVAAFVTASLAWATGRRQATVIAMVAVIVYSVFVGASPSVLRAAVMAEVMLGATLAGRPRSALTAVTFAGALLTAWQPLLIDDVSFQLSLGATLGLVLLASPLTEVLKARLRPLPTMASDFIAEQVAVTTAASLAVAPIMAASFGRLSLVSLAANLLAAPSFALALGSSALTATLGLVDPAAGRAAGEVAYLPLTYLVSLAALAASLPHAAMSVHGFGTSGAAAAYAAAILLLLAVLRRSRPELDIERTALRMRVGPIMTLVLLLLAAYFARDSIFADDRRLRFDVLDVGQGDSLLITTPAGHRILVDGGPSGERVVQALGEVLGPSERRIDLMVLTHGQEDHVAGLVEVLRRFDVRQVLTSPLSGEIASYGVWRDEVARQSLPLTMAANGQWIDLGRGARIEVLAPQTRLIQGSEDDLNNNCVVLRLVYGSVSFLLTGDLGTSGEDALLNSGATVNSTVLKVGHHGSETSTTLPFLDAVTPDVAVISVGADNSYGHPSPTLRLRLAHVPLLRTDLNGAVHFETDGRALWIQPSRGSFATPVGY